MIIDCVFLFNQQYCKGDARGSTIEFDGNGMEKRNLWDTSFAEGCHKNVRIRDDSPPSCIVITSYATCHTSGSVHKCGTHSKSKELLNDLRKQNVKTEYARQAKL